MLSKPISGYRNARLLVLLCWGVTALAAAAGSPPAWWSEPPVDDAQSWYGTGEGADIDEARRGALRGVAAKLGSSIAGEVSNRTVVTSTGGKEKVDISALSAVTEQIANTTFTRFEVAQTARGGRGVFVLVKVDKPAFIADTRRELQSLDRPLRECEAALPTQSRLDRFLSLRRLKKEIDDGTRLSLQLLGAGVGDEGSAGWARYVALRQTRDALATQLTFELRAPPADADIAAAVAAFLSEQGMRSASARTTGASPLTIQSDSRQDELFGSKMVKIKVHLAVLDDQGRAAATKEYEVPGSSRYDFKGAREDAVKKLSTMLRAAGPVAGLGFKE